MAKKTKKIKTWAIALIILAVAIAVGGTMLALGVFNSTCENSKNVNPSLCANNPQYTGIIRNNNKKCKDRKCSSSDDEVMCCQVAAPCPDSCSTTNYQRIQNKEYCSGAQCQSNECCELSAPAPAPVPAPEPAPGEKTFKDIKTEVENLIKNRSIAEAEARVKNWCDNQTGEGKKFLCSVLKGLISMSA